jgi:hypothetical protein
MTNKSRTILAAIGLIVFFFSMEGWGADWKSYMTDDFAGWFYDAGTIIRPSKDTRRVWGKIVYTDKGVMQRVAQMEAISRKYRELASKYNDLEAKELASQYNALASKYKDLNYEQNLIEINCAKRKSRTLEGTSYSKAGLGLWNYTPEAPDWN